MSREPRPTHWLLALLVPLALAGCNGEEGKKPTGTAAQAPQAPAEPEKPKPKPGEKGYVAPRDGKATPPLVDATKRGNLEAVKAMLDTGVDANAARGNGLTALHIAAGENLLEIAKALLEKGADPAAAFEGGITALHLAAASPKGLEMVQLLLAHKAPLEARDSVKQQTPLGAAAVLGHLESVRALLAAGADVGAKDGTGRTPLIAASIGGHLEVVHLLLDEGAPIDVQDSAGATALHASVRFGHPELAAALLARGAKVDVVDVQKMSALHYAARFDHRDIAELLLANGANILLEADEGLRPAQLAAIGKYEAFAKYLSDLEKAAGGPGLDAPLTPQKPGEKKP
jgi:ankyrin repeat protein